MAYALKIGVLYLRIVYCFLKFLPKEDKIVFLSRQSNHKSIDFQLIEEEVLKRGNYKLVFIFKTFNKNYFDYFLCVHKKMYHLATSKICIVDSYVEVVSVLNHKDLKVIQIWHSMAAIKKFGYQSIDKKMGRKSSVSEAIKMHRNYDLIISGSDEMAEYFSEAFNSIKVLSLGLPRIDYLVNNKDLIRDMYKDKINKPIVLYAPTFRDGVDKLAYSLIDNFDFENFDLIVKLHPKTKIKVTDDRLKTDLKMNTMKLLPLVDYVITDYSAISVEASAIDKKVFFYIDDYDEYIKDNGVNINIKEEFSELVVTKDNIVDKLNSEYNYEKLKEIKSRFVKATDGKITERLVDIILESSR